jgi:hypothetical protein
MRRLSVLATVVMLGRPLAAWSQEAHDPDDEAACSPDVMRLCQHFIPNRDEIITCLTVKKKDLSPACFKVFSRPSPQRAAEEGKRKRKPAQPN